MAALRHIIKLTLGS